MGNNRQHAVKWVKHAHNLSGVSTWLEKLNIANLNLMVCSIISLQNLYETQVES